jgi:hypothetical protein
VERKALKEEKVRDDSSSARKYADGEDHRHLSTLAALGRGEEAEDGRGREVPVESSTDQPE